MRFFRVSTIVRCLPKSSSFSSVSPSSILGQSCDSAILVNPIKTLIVHRDTAAVHLGLGFPPRSFHGVPERPEGSIPEDASAICRLLAGQTDSAGVASVLDRSGAAVSTELAEEVLKRLGNAGMLALGFFRWAEKQAGFRHTAGSFHALIDALGKIKQFRLIWSIVESMHKRGVLSKDTFLLMARRYARARKPDEAIQAFDRMREFGLEPGVADYNRLIDTIAKSRNVARAQRVFEEAKKKGFNPI